MRTDPRRRRRHRLAASYFGFLLTVGALVVLSPCFGLFIYGGEGAVAVALGTTAAGLAAIGLPLWWSMRPAGEPPDLRLGEACVVIVAAWVVIAAASAVPLSTICDLTFAQALFEAVSAWTTTGLSVLDVTGAPRLILLYRSTMQLAGGAGIAIAALAVLGGPMGPRIAFAEGRSDRLAPTLRWSALTVLSLYGGYVLVGILGYRFAGMSTFDAINHAFAAVSTGGFSTRPESIGHWDSPAIELVSMPLMIAGSVNFQIAYLAVRGRLRAAARSHEPRMAAGLLAAGSVILGVTLSADGLADGTRLLRTTAFEVVSAVTTTGFSTTSYNEWPPLAVLLLVAVMMIGGGSGSTAGGLKQVRVYLLVRLVGWEVTRALSSPHTVQVRQSRRGDETQRHRPDELLGVVAVVVLYLLTLAILVGVMTAYGYAIADAVFEATSTLSTVGLSVGVTSADTPSAVLLAQSVGMLLGRLELLVVVVAVGHVVAGGRASWRVRRSEKARAR